MSRGTKTKAKDQEIRMKVIWGFEPKNQNDGAIRGMADLLGQFAGGSQNLSVGFVVTGHESYLYNAFDVPREERFSKYPKKLILEDLKRAKVQIKPHRVHIVEQRTLSTTAAVDKFLSFAKSKNAELVALFTQNKHGFERLVVGSFAETAVHRSRIDLLVSGPKTKYPDKVRSVVFATDFGPDVKRNLRRALEICKQLRARLTVFHAAEIIYRWSLDETNPEILAYRRKTKKMADWIENECKKARVPGSVVLSTEFESIPDLVFKTARAAKADLIVVSAKVGPFGALMGGSVTRNIIRQGSYPVLVLKR